jgi:hypothetical protein
MARCADLSALLFFQLICVNGDFFCPRISANFFVHELGFGRLWSALQIPPIFFVHELAANSFFEVL